MEDIQWERHDRSGEPDGEGDRFTARYESEGQTFLLEASRTPKSTPPSENWYWKVWREPDRRLIGAHAAEDEASAKARASRCLEAYLKKRDA